MKPVCRVAALALGLLLMLPGRAEASALDLFGFGSRSSGMGATGTAHAYGYEAVYANPAGVAFQRHKRLTIGYLFGYFDLGMSANLRRIRPPRADNTYGLIIGATIPLNFPGWMKDKMWIGMGFYLPTGVVTRARVPLPGQPYFLALESRTQVVGVQVAGAVEPYPGVKIGAGVLALAALTGTVWISADAGGNIGSTVEQQLIVDYAPIFGALWTLPWWEKRLTLGLTYRGESIAGFDVVLVNTLGNSLPISIPVLTISGVAQFDPQQIAFEAAMRLGRGAKPGKGWLLAVQICWKDWSRHPLPTQNVTFSSPPQPLPGLRDTVVPRIGVEYSFKIRSWTLEIRGGYFFEPTPVPEQTGLSNLLDNHRHAFSVGFGTAYHRRGTSPFSADVFFQYHVLMPREQSKDQAALVGADPMLLQYARSRFRTWGQLIVAGVQVGVEF